MWKAASKPPLNHTGPAAFKTRLSLLSAGMGALDVHPGGHKFHRPTWGQCPSVSDRAAVDSRALEALKMKDRQTARAGTRCAVEVDFELDNTSKSLFFQIRGCEPTWG